MVMAAYGSKIVIMIGTETAVERIINNFLQNFILDHILPALV